MALDLTGRTLGKVQVLKRIARGGQGTVWRGRVVGKKQKVAVKVLNEDRLGDKQAIQQFEDEFALCHDLRHPALLRYHAIGRVEEAPYIVMEFFAGQPLSQLLREDGRRAAGHAERMVPALAEGLGYLHAQGVVHRDIKPDNILVDGDWNVKVIDFATAARIKKGITNFLHFQRYAVGTPSYIAPEQARRKSPHPAADIYSLGVTLFELFTGKLPFIADSEQRLLQEVLKTPPPSMLEYNRHLTGGLNKLVLAMLAKDPTQRPADMGAVRRRFERAGVFVAY